MGRAVVTVIVAWVAPMQEQALLYFTDLEQAEA
jgi:hypothetical protein